MHSRGWVDEVPGADRANAQKGLLQVICGTDNARRGINVPIRTGIFRVVQIRTGRNGIERTGDFHKIGAGRAQGFDDRGWVAAPAPEHVIEKPQRAEKAARDGRKR